MTIAYRNIPVVNKGVVIDLRSITDAEIESLLNQARGNDKCCNTGVPATWEWAELLLAMFDCHRCGLCCEGSIFKEPMLPLTKVERRVIAHYLGWRTKRLRHFCTHRNDTLYLKLPCPFYDGRKHNCTIYEVRPLSCQFYPLQSAIQVKTPDGELLPPTLVVDVDCPASEELLLKIVRLRKAAFKWRQVLGTAEEEAIAEVLS